MNDSDRAIPRRLAVQLIGGALLAPVAAMGAGRGDDVVIGQSIQLTGPYAPSLVPVIKGQALAIDQQNARGGIGGRKLRLITLDDGFDPKRTVSNIVQLIDQEGACAIFGLASPFTVAAALPVVQAKQVPLVNVYTGAPALRAKHYPYFFTSLASLKDEVSAILKNLRVLGRTRIAVVHQDYMADLMPSVEAEMLQLGVTLVSKAATDLTPASAAAAAREIALAQPNAIVVMSSPASLVPFVLAAKQQIAAPIYCLSLSYAQAAIDALGDNARGLAFAQPIPDPGRLTSTLTRDFRAAADAEKVPVSFAGFYGYLNMRVLLEGLKRTARNPTPAGLVAALEGMRKVDLGGYTVDFSPANHHGSRFVELTIVGPGGRAIR